MFFRILGQVQVDVDGAAVDLGGPTVRRALVALLAAGGEAVSNDALAAFVWDADQPDDVTAALRVVIHRLRRALGPTARENLQRRPAGYALAVAPEFIDGSRFARLLDDGLAAMARGDARDAAETLTSALTLWRGQPFLELADAVALSGARQQLIELHEVAVEELYAAQLACGDTSRAIAGLSEAVTTSPYRERRWELLALALYRSGRQTHALAELRRVRELLVDELGIEPGAALAELERRMLDHDPGLLADPTPSHRKEVGGTRPLRPVSAPVTSLIGRSAELVLLADLLAEMPLVTLLGPAGVGKTRLAIEHAVNTAGQVWVVRLADVRSSDAVAVAVAEAVGLFNADHDPAAAVIRVLADQTALLVVDNCEHVIDAVAQLISPLMQQCPGIQVLATSRRPLGTDGEHIMTVDPLVVRDAAGNDGPAVELLLDRVGSHHVGWRAEPEDLESARNICTLLDGLPLGIELAAARERAFGLAEIATHLQARIDVLGKTPHGSPSPHASLNAAIAWSVDLLSEADRAFLLRLWPFEGGFTWQAAAAMQPAGQPAGAVLAVLASLVDRSVIVADRASRRYRLMETVRLYCAGADPDAGGTEDAYATWVCDLIAQQIPLIPTHRIGEAFGALSAELPNLRAGLGYLLQRDPLTALRNAAPLEWAWVSIGALHEGMQVVRNALTACPDAPIEDRARGLNALGIMSFHAGDSHSAITYSYRALSLLGDSVTGERADLRFAALVNRAGGANELGDVHLARDSLDQIASDSRLHTPPDWVIACAMVADGAALLLQGKTTDGYEQLHAASTFAEQCGFTWAQGTAELVLARRLLRGDADLPDAVESLRATQRAVRVFNDQGNVFDVLAVLYTSAHALAALSLPGPAVRIRAAVIEQARRIGADTRHYARLAGQDVEQRMLEIEGEYTRAANAGRSMRTPDIIAFFDDVIASHTFDALSA